MAHIKVDKSKPDVSVVIPIYNVAPYIEKCARSIFEQTLGNLEIIFISDCTPDNSIDIIKHVLNEYPNRKDSTRILSMINNSGLASVRRRGILEASGEYIIHCDGDDWIDPSLYQQLYDRAIKESADIVLCDFIYEITQGPILYTQPNISGSSKLALENWYRHFFHMSCANKLVRRSLLLNNNILPWPGLNMWEDNGLMIRTFYHATKVSQIHSSFYHYNRMNETSISAAYGKKQVDQMIAIAENIDHFFEDKPDRDRFERTITALKFYAKINLITDRFSGLTEFHQIFPGAEKIASKLDKNAFSYKGRIRWRMTRYKLAPLFILLFKLYKMVKKKQ